MHIVYWVIIAVLLTIVRFSLNRPEKVVEVIKERRDTTVVKEIDTLTLTKIIQEKVVVVDTMFIALGNSSIPIPIGEYRFFKPNEYDITARGYNVTIPSVTIFPKTITRTITNTVEKEVVSKKCALYGGFGITAFNGRFAPEASISFASPRKWLFSAKIGYFENNPYYGGTIQYRLTK